jgi:glycosyltransferase involved in cell wall biosynthesis
MKIGINARYIQKQRTGIENYLHNLIKHLKLTDHTDEFMLYFGNDKPIPQDVLGGNFTSDIPSMSTNSQIKRILWEHFYIPQALKRDKIDVFHEPSFIAPIFKSCPTITTVYDLAFIFHPECFTRRNVLYLNTMLSRSVRSSDRIIAISNSTKNDIINHFNIEQNKVRVVYCGYNDYFRAMDSKEACAGTLRKHGITGEFLLNVSMISPRKNLLTLLRSFKSARAKRKTGLQLVIAGSKGWLYEEIFEEVSKLSLEKYVIFTGYIPDEELLHLYNSAALMVYPSIYEGFGLPVLEAMACGCPVIASNTSSLPEVCGDAALLVNPLDAEGLSESICKALEDNAFRNRMAVRGFQRIKSFSWSKAANETLQLYKELA